MKILAIEHENPTAKAADFAPHLDAEARHAWTPPSKASSAKCTSAPTGPKPSLC